MPPAPAPGPCFLCHLAANPTSCHSFSGGTDLLSLISTSHTTQSFPHLKHHQTYEHDAQNCHEVAKIAPPPYILRGDE